MENYDSILFMSKVFAAGFMITILIGFIYGIYTGYRPDYFGVLDELKEGKINIGYYEPQPVIEACVVIEEKPEKELLKGKFAEDCVAGLVNLGVKKKQAKEIFVKFMKENPDCESLDTFIKKVFQK